MAFLERLNRPSPWSTQLMPHHRNMVRSQCRVLEAAGSGLAAYALTLRLSPATRSADRLRGFLRDAAGEIASSPGLTAARLLRTETPDAGPTTEQRIRGGRDGAADWIFIANGYDRTALQRLRHAALADEALWRQGVEGAVEAGLYALSHAMT